MGLTDAVPEIALGILISIVSWLMTLRLVRPSIEISEEISRRDAGQGEPRKYVYRIKIRNRRRFRDAINVTVACRFGAAGFFEDRPKNVSYYTIPLQTTELHLIRARRGRIFQIHLHEAEKLRRRLQFNGSALAEKIADGSIRLEELLDLPRAKLYFFVGSSDSLSNTPAVSEQRYGPGSVAIGLFELKTTKINQEKLAGYERAELDDKPNRADDEADEDDDDRD